jgi:hypothetical protein
MPAAGVRFATPRRTETPLASEVAMLLCDINDTSACPPRQSFTMTSWPSFALGTSTAPGR